MRNRGVPLRLLLIPALFACATAVQAQTPMTKLTVRVTNDSDRPVDRAAVIVRFIQGRDVLKLGKHIRTTYELRTNQEGEATIPPIPQGKILVQVNAKGYQTFGHTYDVDEEAKTVEIKLNPPQQQYSAHQP
ncbi:MAG TPA: carboxypeptidase-like regulatory domain-containing protein [Bryobacteraceae bacterium]|jgi:hypothetical protein|nr:carboxypeptidase-like regulatory domain-containing protein [Bryobacteraceae bacterium]